MFSLDIRCFAGQLDATQLDPKYMGRNLANICGTAMVFFLFWPTNMIRPKPPNCEFKHTPEKKKKKKIWGIIRVLAVISQWWPQEPSSV
jgi:hypothetical protein